MRRSLVGEEAAWRRTCAVTQWEAAARQPHCDLIGGTFTQPLSRNFDNRNQTITNDVQPVKLWASNKLAISWYLCFLFGFFAFVVHFSKHGAKETTQQSLIRLSSNWHIDETTESSLVSYTDMFPNCCFCSPCINPVHRMVRDKHDTVHLTQLQTLKTSRADH